MQLSKFNSYSMPTCSLAIKLQEDIKSEIGFIFIICYENLYKTLLLMCFSKRLCQTKYDDSKSVSMYTFIYILKPTHSPDLKTENRTLSLQGKRPTTELNP